MAADFDAIGTRVLQSPGFNQPSQDSATGLGTAMEAVDALSRHWAAFSAMVDSFDDEELRGPIGEVGGPFRESSIFGLIVHVLDELIHHSAEISLLRDPFGAGFSGWLAETGILHRFDLEKILTARP